MTVKSALSIILLLVVSFLSCKKSSSAGTSTPSAATIANIDSITGYYAGITSGDSIYTDTNGVQVLHSFSWADTLHITSPDTATIIVAAKYYDITYSYNSILTTVDSVTTLQTEVIGQNGYITYNTTLLDTANSINHLIVNTWYNYNKHLTTNVTLYKRQ